jgi:hypothetical protein
MKTSIGDKYHDLLVEYLEDHPLFTMLHGNPLSISMLAFQCMTYSIKQIYEQANITCESLSEFNDSND